MNDNVMTMDNPYDDKWFVFCRSILNDTTDKYNYNKQDKITRKYARIAKYLSENGNLIGEPMLTEDFIECVRCGGVTIYDGSAEYVSYDTLEKRDKPVHLNLVDLENHIDTDFVIWYNK